MAAVQQAALRRRELKVDLVTRKPRRSVSGIGRYVRDLHEQLGAHVDAQLVRPEAPPLAGRFPSLQHLPIGVSGRRAGSIVHFTEIMGSALMLWNPPRPAVGTVHDLGPLEFPAEWAMHDPLARMLLRLALAGLRRMDHIVTVSEYSRQSVLRHLRVQPDRVTAVASAVDHTIFRPLPGALAELVAKRPDLQRCTRPWLLYVGSELPRKNMPVLLEALQILSRTFPGVSLLKVGAAGQPAFRRETVERARHHGVEGRLHVVEGLSDAELALLYNAADVYVHPSMLEGFGYPLVEAMACGLPIVCADRTSLPELVGDAALTVDANHPGAFAAAAAAVLGEPQRRGALREAGLRRAARFTFQQMASEVFAVYAALEPRRSLPVDAARPNTLR